MEPSSVAEQRATAVAKLKRAASLPRMKDGRRPPMHVEAVSEGERVGNDDGLDEESVPDSDGKQGQEEEKVDQEPGTDAPNEEVKGEEVGAPPPDTPVVAEVVTPVRTKRRSRSRTRSRGSRDLKGKIMAKQSPLISSASHTNESSADEYYTSAPGEDAPPSPPLISPIPLHFALPNLPASRFLTSPFFYPGTTPPTPLPTLDDLQHGMRMGLYRSNSTGAARMMAMQKLTGGTEPLDIAFISPSPTPPPGSARVQRNNTVSGGERMAARRMLLHRLGNRIKEADGDQTSGGEELVQPVIPPKRRRRRSKRNSSRASTVVDDREEREPPSTTPNTPVVPPSPLPFQNVPEPPRPPSSAAHFVNGISGRVSLVKVNGNGNATYNYDKPTGHRGVVVEDEDDVPERHSPLPHPPSTPGRGFSQRIPHTSDAPSTMSTDSTSASAVSVPVFLLRKTGFGRDIFPASPFATPLKEKLLDDDEEQVVYQEVQNRSSEISWVAEPLPVRRMPLHDEDDEDDEEGAMRLPEAEEGDQPSEVSDQQSNRSYGRVSPQLTSQNNLVVDIETSPEPSPAHAPPSPISPISPIGPLPSTASDAQTAPHVSPVTYPARLLVATPSQLDRSPSDTDFPDWDDTRATVTDSTIKRGESISTWEKMKTFALGRSGSVNGRRSRTNSIGIRDRRNNTDSSVSRESRASMTKGDQQGHDLQSPSASTSILSLPIAPQIGMHSPVPPATPAELKTYGYESNSKLFPFPGMKQLEEQRRARGMSQSASNPDVASPNGLGMDSAPSSGSSNTATRALETGRERKLSHQASDSRLLPKFNNIVSPPPVSSVPSSASQADYFSIPSNTLNVSATGSLKLPMNREGVKKWLSAKKLFSSQTSPVHIPNASTSPVSEPRTRIGDKKPSLSDLLLGRKEIELAADWEELSHDNSRTPTATIGNQRVGGAKATEVHMDAEVLTSPDSSPETIHSPRSQIGMDARTSAVASPSYVSDFSASYPSPPDAPSSTTPDPQSSLDTRSTSESYSESMLSSHHSPDPPSSEISQRAIILERLDEVLGRGSRSSVWPSTIDDPPRKLVLSSPVLQVANANIVKDRFLFLFNDILVIAKPIVQDAEALLDTVKPSPLDRRFIVKSVCQLRELRLSSDRDEARSKPSSSSSPMSHPVIRSFVHQFTKDPDNAISALFTKTSTRDDPVALGQLLFRTLDLDRARLGEYMSRRTSKVVLKAFIDSFGLECLRIDKALRVYLQSIHIPSKSGSLEYLLDSFASRWHEANAGIVAFDKDLAIRLVRAVVQLNEVMHGSIAQEPGMTGYPRRNIIVRDFVDAFRKYDPRSSVSDELLNKIYTSIRRERLSQARNTASSGDQPDIPITIKRPLPSRLTYCMQSDPIILRIPQPDPQLAIQLFGKDLVFDPPVLEFAKSSEASFRVKGTSLGSKTIIMWRTGPNGILYSGLPFSNPLVVERAFMRNTFQLAFVNHTGAKRKYMFSVDDPLIRHQWTVSLKRQIDIASSSVSPAYTSGSSSKAQKANESLAFKVLQETLINSEEHPSVPLSPVDQALIRLNGASSIRHGVNGSVSSTRAALAGGASQRRSNGASPHIRSKSRSQVYHRHGPGKLESELSDSPDRLSDDEPCQQEASFQSQRQRLWSGRDLEIVCRQNSLTTSMLAYLQVGLRDHDATNGAVS